MSDFMNYVFSYLSRALVLLVPAAVVCGGVLFAAWRICRKKGKVFPWGRVILALMLAAYLLVLLYITVLRGSYGGYRYANLHLFRAWREAWNNFSEKNWMNVLLNIGMFVPLGALLPLLWKKLRKWYWMLPVGFLTTLAIETVQYVTCRGLFDVDDLFTNTLGAMLGFWLVLAALSIREKNGKRAALHGAALLAAAASIGGIFLAYQWQEYGNLSTSPAFRVDTSDTVWTVSCELSSSEQTVSIYQTKPWSKAECEAFGRQFLANLGIPEVDVTVYNEEVYLRESMGNRILEVYYRDGSYDYKGLASISPDVAYVQLDEQTLRAELLEYGIQIPAEAEFSSDEEGGHYFTLDRYVDGNTMIDGKLACRYEEGFGMREISNDLVSFTYYGEGEIISPKAAVDRLKDGWLAGGEWIERRGVKEIEVLSCELDFQVDTKGFYQPVYQVGIRAAGTDTVLIETVPALK